MRSMALLAFVVLAFHFVGCERPTMETVPGRPDRIQVETPEEADLIFQSFSVECEDPATCHPAVALLLAKDTDTSISVCTAALVNDKYIFTNKHCLPQDAMYTGANCRGRVLIKFPATNEHAASTIDCEKVEMVSPYYVLGEEAKQQTDFAFIRLATTSSRPILEFDTSGVDDGETLKLIRMTPQMELLIGVISELECRAVQNTVVTPVFKSRFSPVVHVNDCPIVKGNSGSPMLGKNGRIKGIIQQGKGDPDAAPLITKTFGRGSNAACIRFHPIGLYGDTEGECAQDLSDEAVSAAFNELWEKQIQFDKRASEVEKRAHAFAKRAPRILRWQIESEVIPFDESSYDTLSGGILMSVRLSPECIASTKFRNKRAERAKTKFKLAEWNLRWEVDDQLRLKSRVEEKIIDVVMEFSPREIAASGEGEFVLRMASGGGGPVSDIMRLSACGRKVP